MWVDPALLVAEASHLNAQRRTFEVAVRSHGFYAMHYEDWQLDKVKAMDAFLSAVGAGFSLARVGKESGLVKVARQRVCRRASPCRASGCSFRVAPTKPLLDARRGVARGGTTPRDARRGNAAAQRR